MSPCRVAALADKTGTSAPYRSRHHRQAGPRRFRPVPILPVPILPRADSACARPARRLAVEATVSV
jgi:hypothetical protein